MSASIPPDGQRRGPEDATLGTPSSPSSAAEGRATDAESGLSAESGGMSPSVGTAVQSPEQAADSARASRAGKSLPAIPGYEIVDELGRGGMGVVYKAVQRAAKRVVALKMIRDGALAGPEHHARFRVEAEAAARFQHPNLVRIYEVGEHGGQPFFSMEYAEGGSLEKRIAGAPQPPRAAAELVRTLAEAIQYAHDKDILHRDLKPANILLTAEGRPLVADFGLAKRLDSETAATRTGAVLGTASYMSPEQAQGHKVGPAADVYSLGAILYELLTGQPPFRGPTLQETVERVVHEEPVPPTQLRPEVPADLEVACLKCLEKEPGQRYPSANELADDLARFLADEPVTAVPLAEWERQARWARAAGFEVEDVMTIGVRDIVYKARQVHLNRPVALKVLASPGQADPAALARQRQEAETVAALDHPNIVRIHSSGELRGRTYLAFEYVAGGSLIERFVDEPVPPREAVRLVHQLAEAMHYAHQRGVLHCALKPSNVLLTKDGVPKIAGFGLSVLQGQPDAEPRPAFRRLPSYMAPELADGRFLEVGPAADVYALGALLYKLLTGEPPFLGETVAETLEQVRSQIAVPPSSMQPCISQELDAICARCLAKEPSQRYGSAGELAEDLEDFFVADQPKVMPGGPAPQIPGYQVLRELGRGSMSIVYEARQLASGRLVALKTLQRGFRYGKPLRDLLREIAEDLSRLQHPNLVRVYECGEQEGRPYFVMELLPGGSLDQRADRQMPVKATATLVRTLAQALGAVHRQGILHGDLKPSRVLLAADGTPKITGFKIARRQLTQEEQAQGTVAGPGALGTPRYMAPEQFRGAGIGPPTDVYALGLILYELLTGWLPFRAPTVGEVMVQVLTELPQPPRDLRPDIPPDLEALCLRCLAKKPEERYPSAGILAEQLDRVLAGQPLSWQPAPASSNPSGQYGPALRRRLRKAQGKQPPTGQPSSEPGTWARLLAWLTRRPEK